MSLTLILVLVLGLSGCLVVGAVGGSRVWKAYQARLAQAEKDEQFKSAAGFQDRNERLFALQQQVEAKGAKAR